MAPSSKTTGASISGVMTVLPTPFNDHGAVDLESLGSLVDYAITEGSDGLVCFGLASELFTLTDGERSDILSTVIERAAGRVPVIAGSENKSIETAAARTADYCAAGVSAVMVLPPTAEKPDDAMILDYYREVARAAGHTPVIVQDAPAWSGVQLSVSVLERVREAAPTVTHVKVENPPNQSKISALAEVGFTCIGGYGALHFMEDVHAGVCGVMYGAGSIGGMAELWHAASSDSERAWLLFESMLPLLAFQMSSLDVFIAVQKRLLHNAGIIASASVRPPGRELSDHQKDWLELILRRWEGHRT